MAVAAVTAVTGMVTDLSADLGGRKPLSHLLNLPAPESPPLC
jgi:hypothetical protein